MGTKTDRPCTVAAPELLIDSTLFLEINMTALEREVTNYMISTGSDSAEAVEAANHVVQSVKQGRIQDNLLKMIQAMGDYITSEDDVVRSKALGLISFTLRHCDPDAINESAVSVLVNFYCDRLEESTCAPNILEGFVALTDFAHLNDASAVTIAKNLIEMVDVQRFPQATRLAAFRVLEHLLQRHLTALQSMNDEFISGFIRVVDGEKDPRNLICAFGLARTVAENFRIAEFVKDLFEVTFCYFPITFRPPPNDPYGITAQDLKVKLRECLSASSLFAQLAVPLLVEKLASTSGSAKKDAMETLAACAPVYGADALMPNMDEVMRTLKVEVFHATDPSLEEAALACIEQLIATLSSADALAMDTALKPVLDECLGHLRDPDLKNVKQVGRLLCAAASASKPACHVVVTAVVPLLLHQYRDTQLATRQKAILSVILELLEANLVLSNQSVVDGHNERPMLLYKDDFFAMGESAMLASNEYDGLRLAGLRCLKLMAFAKGFLSPNEFGMVIQSFHQLLLDDTSVELRSAALDALRAIAVLDPPAILKWTVPVLGERLQRESTQHQPAEYRAILRAIETLSVAPSLFSQTIPLLLSALDHACQKESDPTYPHAIVSTMLSMAHAKVAEQGDNPDVAACMDTIVLHFTLNTIQVALGKSTSQALLADDVVDSMAKLTAVVIQQHSAESQATYLARFFQVFLHGHLDAIGGDPSLTGFHPLESNAPIAQKKTTPFFTAVVVSCRREVVLPVPSVDAFLDQLVSLAQETNDEMQSMTLVRMIGAVINKWKDAATLSRYVVKVSSSLETTLNAYPERRQTLWVYLWIIKALILRSHPLGYEMTTKVIDWCRVPGSEAPQGFDTLVGDDLLSLNKASFANATILYKQRFFNTCLPLLMEGLSSASSDVKPNFLIALSLLLKNVPRQILLSELPPLVPVLIQSLSLPDSALKVSTLDTFRLAITEAPDVVTTHLRSMLPALLDLLTQKENPLSVRMAALRCLGQFPESLPADTLAPHAKYVIRQLGRSLDDKKRLVRREAVDCRAKWFIEDN